MGELQLMKSKSFRKQEKIKFKIAWIPDQLPTNIIRGNERQALRRGTAGEYQG